MGEISRDRVDISATISGDIEGVLRARALEIARGSKSPTTRAGAQKPKPKAATPARKPAAKPAAQRGVDERGNPHALVLTARATAGRLIIAHRQT